MGYYLLVAIAQGWTSACSKVLDLGSEQKASRYLVRLHLLRMVEEWRVETHFEKVDQQIVSVPAAD